MRTLPQLSLPFLCLWCLSWGLNPGPPVLGQGCIAEPPPSAAALPISEIWRHRLKGLLLIRKRSIIGHHEVCHCLFAFLLLWSKVHQTLRELTPGRDGLGVLLGSRVDLHQTRFLDAQ